jgi:murein DD-endopeptidase MepM/ murein hydrolase activator NlpD
MGLLLPSTTGWVTCSWQCHKDRNPPSSQPGTDYGTGFGEPLYAVENGVVSLVVNSISSASGRYLGLRLDDGRETYSLHLSKISVSQGQRVTRGQKIGETGASGFGDEWYYGPHVHQTLWPHDAYDDPTIDFAKNVGPANEEDAMPKLHKVTIERSTPQRVEGEEEYIRLNDEGHISVFVGHDVVFGEFALRFDVVKASENGQATIAVYPKLATLDDDGNTESTTSVGIQEFPVSTGTTSVSVALAPISVKQNQRVRFMVRCTDGLVVDITAGAFRGGYWDE